MCYIKEQVRPLKRRGSPVGHVGFGDRCHGAVFHKEEAWVTGGARYLCCFFLLRGYHRVACYIKEQTEQSKRYGSPVGHVV